MRLIQDPPSFFFFPSDMPADGACFVQISFTDLGLVGFFFFTFLLQSDGRCSIAPLMSPKFLLIITTTTTTKNITRKFQVLVSSIHRAARLQVRTQVVREAWPKTGINWTHAKIVMSLGRERRLVTWTTIKSVFLLPHSSSFTVNTLPIHIITISALVKRRTFFCCGFLHNKVSRKFMTYFTYWGLEGQLL